MNKLFGVSLTNEERKHIIDNHYNFLVIFPDGSSKPCYTQKEGVRKVSKWNKKNPFNKTCSLYSLKRIIVVKPEEKTNCFKRLFKYLIGYYI